MNVQGDQTGRRERDSRTIYGGRLTCAGNGPEAVLECLEQVSENGGIDKDRLDNASDSFGMLSWFDLCYLVPLLCGILWLSRLDRKR